ncbi:MAG TPA: hypothetical protein DD379_23720 [Cyanobacteria bacterium UBA11162]|nr:hypothetical protein [Cyanobacteria bacterium UBA11162]
MYILIFEPMKYIRYFRSILIGLSLSSLLFLLLVLSQLGAPTESSRWNSEIYAIKSRIAKSIQTPKLVIVGGSNVLFGISCQMLHEQTKIPCVNGGTLLGLGPDYLFTVARSWLKPGDLVLLPLEYEQYQDNGIPTSDLIDYVLARDYNYLLSTDLVTKIRLIGGISYPRLTRGILAKIKPPQPQTTGFQSKTLNEYGDETNLQQSDISEEMTKKVAAIKPMQIGGYISSSHGMDSIAKFVKWCETNHIKVVATWPNTIWFEDYNTPSKQELFRSIEHFYHTINVPVLGQPRDFMYDKSLFWDTIYHLNDRGVHHRTKQTIDLLTPSLKSLNSS